MESYRETGIVDCSNEVPDFTPKNVVGLPVVEDNKLLNWPETPVIAPETEIARAIINPISRARR